MFSHLFERSAIFDLTQNLGDCGGDGLPAADFVGHFHHSISVALTPELLVTFCPQGVD